MTYEQKWANHTVGTRPTYATWHDMRSRCYNPRDPEYHRYGERGITVCDRWRDDYDTFVEDMGLRPEGMRIERIDNSGNYELSNCKWATQREQMRNTRRTRLITIQGRTQAQVAWAAEIGIDVHTLKYRIRRGYSDEKILAAPDPRKQNSKGAGK